MHEDDRHIAPSRTRDRSLETILVIDDTRANLQLVAEYLTAVGFRVIVAPSGMLGLARAQRDQPSLILLDILMPHMDGFETCRRLKSEPSTIDIPVIFMTALHDTEYKVRGFEAGGVDYITKPIQQEELLARVTTHLRIHTLTRHLERLVDERTRELVSANQALRQEIEQHEQTARQLVAAREAAERASAAKSRFLANMNHELRTPLQGILGTASLLLGAELGAAEHELVRTLSEAGRMMLALINDVLDFSKLECDRIELEPGPTDVRRCVAAAMDLVAVPAAEKQLALTCEIEPEVPASLLVDALRVQQVLVNLLGNAVKFTERGGVAVRVGMAPSGPEAAQAADTGGCASPHELHVSVADTGIGISPEDQHSLFQMFHQVDSSSTRRYGGTGIGLALSKKLVESMGGRIRVESDVGRGSTFHVTLRAPAAEVSTKAPAAPLDLGPEAGFLRPRRGAALRVLLAEDNPINHRVAMSLLGRMGQAADSAFDGREVLDRVQENPYDVILMDIQMPVMDGLAATRHIRENRLPAEQPYIIALTANTQHADRDLYLRSGMDAYLAKPFGIADLEAALMDAAACLERRRDSGQEPGTSQEHRAALKTAR